MKKLLTEEKKNYYIISMGAIVVACFFAFIINKTNVSFYLPEPIAQSKIWLWITYPYHFLVNILPKDSFIFDWFSVELFSFWVVLFSKIKMAWLQNMSLPDATHDNIRKFRDIMLDTEARADYLKNDNVYNNYTALTHKKITQGNYQHSAVFDPAELAATVKNRDAAATIVESKEPDKKAARALQHLESIKDEKIDANMSADFKTTIDNIKKRNSWAIVNLLHRFNFFKTANIFLEDLNMSVSFNLVDGLEKSKINKSDVDIITDSDSISFAFSWDFGVDTLFVNARFRTSGGKIMNFFRLFLIGTLNNNGRTFPLGVIGFLFNERSMWKTKFLEIILGRYDLK